MKLIDVLENPPVRPIDIRRVILDQGLRIDEDTPLQNDIVGQITKAGDTYLISVKPTDHNYRKRFTMAHELGHWFLHKSLIGGGITDKALYRSQDSSRYNSRIQLVHERQANGFASNLLMPEVQFRSLFNELKADVAKSQKRKEQCLYHAFEVSPAAMDLRRRQLGLEW